MANGLMPRRGEIHEREALMTSEPHQRLTESQGPSAAEAGGVLSIDLAALVANWRALKGRVAPADCAAVVKADGYGCGIEPVTAALAKVGCQTFFVADLPEARRVRAAAPNAIIYVLNGVPPGTLSPMRTPTRGPSLAV